MKLKQLTLALLMSLGLAAQAANEKTTVEQVTNSVQLTTDVDYTVTSATPFTTTGSVNIVNTEHAVLILSSIKPSKVLSNWMDYIYINGEKAVDGENCQVKMYNRGAIIFPYSKDMAPLTCYTEQNFGGESCNNYSEGSSGGYMKTLNTSLLNNQIRSFKLKRGYMVTFAIGTGGWGYSRCFIADQEDLEVKTLPNILDKKISSYRIFKWHNAHKAGLASDGRAEANQALNTSWCYDWGQGNASNLPDTEWVPNHIYEDWPSSSTCGSVTGSCHMKTNNEPGNSADDHPQDVATVLGNWENLMRTGMRLCSESSHDGSMNHLKAFIDSIDARGWRCDILDLHCYWASGTFNSLTWYSDNYGNGRPIWISEWIWGASWNHNGAFGDGVTNSQILSETKNLLNILNTNSRVERYAYWNSESKAHIYENGALTELGKHYATMDDGLAYNAANEYIPKPTRLENLSNLNCTYTRTKGTVALTWSDPNGDLTESITVQCKLPGESLYTTLTTLTPKDKNSSSGVTYNYTDTITEPGVYTYRIKAISYNNKTLYTDDATVNVAPAQGTNEFQYGKLSINNADENKVYYSEAFEEATPFVFIGAPTNKNTKFYAGNITKNSSKSYFTYQPLAWQTNDGTLSNNEEIPFMALQAEYDNDAKTYSPRNYKFGDLDCEVGLVSSNKATGSDTWTDVTEVTFRQPFPTGETPIVLTEIRNPSYATASSNATSLNVRVFDVTNTGFKFIIYSEAASTRKVAIAQSVCYFAIAPGIGTIDAENDLIIAAGHGIDNPIYGISARDNTFYSETTPGIDATKVLRPTLKFHQPTILAALQTNNYPAVTMLRRTDITEKDDNGTTWTTGIKIKRTLDHDLSPGVKTSTTDEAYQDLIGWVAISKYKSGGSAPTAIETLPATEKSGRLSPRIVNGRIHVDGATTFEVYSLAGNKVDATTTLPAGIYVVKANGKTAKVLLK
ncbi:MAG: hypothetical protein IJ693_00815 [Bacteroidaceae bacterium]|nr:hypothetical protein [Bacteroidaceae bacterium]